MIQRPPRPKGSSWFTILDLGRDPLRRPLHYFARFGDTFGGHALGKDFVITRDPAVFEDVLIKKHRAFIKDDITRGLDKLLGRGLLTSDGKIWQDSRRVMLPHFQAQSIERYLEAFHSEADRTLSGWTPGQTFDLHAEMTALSVRIILRCVFGTCAEDVHELERSMQAVMKYFAGFASTSMPLPLWLPSPDNRRFLRAREHLTQVVRRIIEAARQGGAGSSVIQSLLSARDAGDLTEEQLIDEALTLLLAGHETTALALTYTLALLADAPSEQALIREELGRSSTPDSLAALRAQKALPAAIKESMRLYPQSWAVGREALEDMDVGPWAIARKTQVYLYQWAAHQNPRWFEQPEAYRPSRWTPELEAALPRCAYTPFGGGPRICMGNHFAWAELVCVLAGALRRFEFQPVQPFRPRLLLSVTARPKDPVPMRVVLAPRRAVAPLACDAAAASAGAARARGGTCASSSNSR
jgi:cytochrome P450